MPANLLVLALVFSTAAPQEPTDARLQERLDAAASDFDRAHQKFEAALVELGPSAIPELERLSGKVQGPRLVAIKAAIEKIKGLQESLEKLIAALGHDRIETREKATLELCRIGRPARSYLEAALKSEDADVRARSKVLLVVTRPKHQDQVRWESIAEALAKRIPLLEDQMKKGAVSGSDLFAARRDLLKALYKSGQVTLSGYLLGARELAERISNQAQVQFQNGVIPRKKWMEAKLRLLYLDRRLGKSMDDEIQTLQLQWMELSRQGQARGMIDESQALRELVDFLTDPDGDLDE